MKRLLLLAIAFLLVMLASCGEADTGTGGESGLGDIVVNAPEEDGGDHPATDPADVPQEVTIENFTYTLWPEGTELWESQYFVLGTAIDILFMLKNKDWGALGAMVHPEQGLLFSPYGYIEEGAVVLGAGDVKALGADTEIRDWGVFAGKGDPIELTFDEYYNRFIFSCDFTRDPQVAVDQTIQTTLLENLYVLGNGATYVEFHQQGTEEFAYIDWASLRLVFGFYEGEIMLVGIVHDEWTP